VKLRWGNIAIPYRIDRVDELHEPQRGSSFGSDETA